MTSSISRESNSTFNDGVLGKKSDSFIHKESTFHSEGKMNQIIFKETENILNVNSQVI